MSGPMTWLSRVFRRDSAPVPEPRNDGWRNVITGLMTSRDKRSGAFQTFEPVTDLEAREWWLGDDMVKKIIETPPRECMRRGYTIKTSKKEISEAIAGAAEELRFDQKCMEAMMMRRAYGGSALFPVMNDASGDLSDPLDEKRIGQIQAVHLFEPRELQPCEWYNNLTDKKFGTPSVYRFVPVLAGGMPPPQSLTEVHESRLIIFQGIKVSRLHQPGNRVGWGDGVLTAMRDTLRDFGLVWGGAAALLQDFAQAVLKINGLGDMMATKQDNVARDRLAQIDLLRSIMRAIVIDKEDDFERKPTPLSGLPEMLDRFALRLAAAADMPVTLLMGQSPSGMNATGESDRQFFYDRINGMQHDVEPQVEQFLRLLQLSQDGPTDGVEEDVWSIEWNPLWSPTEKEVAETRLLVAQADHIWITDSVVSEDDAAESHFGGDTFSADITIDWAARAKQKKLDDQNQKLNAAAMQAMGRAPGGKLLMPGQQSAPAAPGQLDDALNPGPIVAPVAAATAPRTDGMSGMTRLECRLLAAIASSPSGMSEDLALARAGVPKSQRADAIEILRAKLKLSPHHSLREQGRALGLQGQESRMDATMAPADGVAAAKAAIASRISKVARKNSTSDTHAAAARAQSVAARAATDPGKRDMHQQAAELHGQMANIHSGKTSAGPIMPMPPQETPAPAPAGSVEADLVAKSAEHDRLAGEARAAGDFIKSSEHSVQSKEMKKEAKRLRKERSRMDAFNPDQPRDKDGKFGEGGGSSTAGKVATLGKMTATPVAPEKVTAAMKLSREAEHSSDTSRETDEVRDYVDAHAAHFAAGLAHEANGDQSRATYHYVHANDQASKAGAAGELAANKATRKAAEQAPKDIQHAGSSWTRTGKSGSSIAHGAPEVEYAKIDSEGERTGDRIWANPHGVFVHND